MRMPRLLFALALGAATVAAVPASACTLLPTRCEPDSCDGPLYRQQLREQRQREAIEYGRAMDIAVEARKKAAGLDRAHDVAQLVLPLLVNPVAFYDGSACPPELDDVNDAERSLYVSEENFEADVRTRARLAENTELPRETVMALAINVDACQQEATRAFAPYLATALPQRQLTDLWEFLVSRAGTMPPSDPSQPLNARLVARNLTTSEIEFNFADAPVHVENRRERAWQYLQNHRNGRAVMSAVSQFIQSRVGDGRGEAAICPVAHAETVRLIGELAQP